MTQKAPSNAPMGRMTQSSFPEFPKYDDVFNKRVADYCRNYGVLGEVPPLSYAPRRRCLLSPQSAHNHEHEDRQHADHHHRGSNVQRGHECGPVHAASSGVSSGSGSGASTGACSASGAVVVGTGCGLGNGLGLFGSSVLIGGLPVLGICLPQVRKCRILRGLLLFACFKESWKRQQRVRFHVLLLRNELLRMREHWVS